MAYIAGVLSDKRGNVLPYTTLIAREDASPTGDTGQVVTEQNGSFKIQVGLSATLYKLYANNEEGGEDGPNFSGWALSGGNISTSFVLLDDSDWKIEHYGNGESETAGTHKDINADSVYIRTDGYIKTEEKYVDFRLGSDTRRLRIDSSDDAVFWLQPQPVSGSDVIAIGIDEGVATDIKFYFGSSTTHYIDTNGDFYLNNGTIAGDITAPGAWNFQGLVTFNNTHPQQNSYVAPTLDTEYAPKKYVDDMVSSADDLDFAGDSGTGTVDLDTQTFTLAGTANQVITSAASQTITFATPQDIDTSATVQFATAYLYEANSSTVPQLLIENAGIGDAVLSLKAGGEQYSMGIDNSHGDNPLVIIDGADLIGTPWMMITDPAPNWGLTALGPHAGESFTTGGYAVAIGSYAMASANGNMFSVAVGAGTGRSVTSGTFTAVGSNAYAVATAGGWNTAMGQVALSSLTSGEHNTAVGDLCLDNVTTANRTSAYGAAIRQHGGVTTDDVFMGYRTCFEGTDATSENVMIGSKVAYYGGDNAWHGSVLIGFNVGDALPSSTDVLAIDNNNTATPLIYGDFANNYLNFFGDVGIGLATVATPTSRLEVYATDGTAILTLTHENATVAVDDQIGAINWRGGESSLATVGSIVVDADQDWTATASGSRLSFYTVTEDTVSLVESMRIDSTGDVSIPGDVVIGAAIGTNPATHLQLNSASFDITLLRFTNSVVTSGFDVGIGVSESINGRIWHNDDGYISFGTNNTERMRLHPNTGYSGSLSINTNVVIGSSVLTTVPSATVHIIETTEQMRLQYDSSNYVSYTVASDGECTIDLSNSTPSDMHIACGASKTLELDTAVYDDLQFQVSAGKVPASNTPTFETFTTNTKEYSFAVDDYIDLNANEVPHTWEMGTKCHLHVHLTTKDANSSGSNRYAKFIVYLAYVDNAPAVWAESSWTAEYTIPNGTTALTHLYLDLGDLMLIGYTIGTELKCRIKRIAATGGTEYASNMFITQVGGHLTNNTMGSRLEGTK